MHVCIYVCMNLWKYSKNKMSHLSGLFILHHHVEMWSGDLGNKNIIFCFNISKKLEMSFLGTISRINVHNWFQFVNQLFQDSSIAASSSWHSTRWTTRWPHSGGWSGSRRCPSSLSYPPSTVRWRSNLGVIFTFRSFLEVFLVCVGVIQLRCLLLSK
jgi:hypothetical protein